jgi:hypothetical protein
MAVAVAQSPAAESTANLLINIAKNTPKIRQKYIKIRQKYVKNSKNVIKIHKK